MSTLMRRDIWVGDEGDESYESLQAEYSPLELEVLYKIFKRYLGAY